MIFAITFAVALVASLLCTPLIKSLAHRFGFVDRPDGGRKTHQREVALGGGAAVLLATVAALLVVFGSIATFDSYNWGSYLTGEFFGSYDWGAYLTGDFFRSLLAATLVIVVVGLVDDLTNLRGHFKLIGQLVAAGILIFFGGLQITKISLLGYPFEFGLSWLAIGFTLFWLLGAINAINLIDGIDGLASSVGFVLCLAVAAVTAYQGNYTATLIMLAMAGALLGFLYFNFAPASIFLGDAGSMCIGLVVGAVAIHHSLKSAATVALAVPFAVWSIPILDSVAAILRRKLTGRSVFTADRGHLHHSLLIRGWTVRQAVLFIGLICATTCVAALVCVYVGTVWSELLALGTVIAVVAFLVSTQTFGHIEFALLRERVRLTTRALATRESDIEHTFQERRIRLQGTEDWERLWVGLTESAERYALTSVRLTIDIPALHQSFFATWQVNPDQRGTAASSGSAWTVETPLSVDGRSVGHLTISGRPGERPTLAHISQVVDFAEPIEDDIRQIIAKLVSREGAAAAEPAAAPQPAQATAGTRRSVLGGSRPAAVEAAAPQAIATSRPSS